MTWKTLLFAIAVCGSLPLLAATRPAPKDVPIPGEPVIVAAKKPQPVVAAAAIRQPLTPKVNGTADWGPVAYTYDKAGQIIAIGSNTYAYDGVGRLRSSTTNGISETYDYDRYGNLTVKTHAGYPTNFGVEPANNRVGQPNRNGSIVVSYDGYGNVLNDGSSSYTYDALNVTTTGRSATYLYDADDERVATITGSTYRYTLRGLDQKVLREVSYTAGTWSWSKDYVYRGSELLAEVTPTGTHHYHLDHLGSPRMITDESTPPLRLASHDYFPFGADTPESTNDGQRLRFTGHERDLGGTNPDGTGLDYMHARYYAAAWGRFLSVDSETGIASTPQSWNRFAYTRNNPISRSDPNGRDDTEAEKKRRWELFKQLYREQFGDNSPQIKALRDEARTDHARMAAVREGVNVGTVVGPSPMIASGTVELHAKENAIVVNGTLLGITVTGSYDPDTYQPIQTAPATPQFTPLKTAALTAVQKAVGQKFAIMPYITITWADAKALMAEFAHRLANIANDPAPNPNAEDQRRKEAGKN